jgi:hypothetical protein
VLYVRSDSCFDGAEVACDDDAHACHTAEKGKPNGSRLSFTVNAGQTYFIVVDGADGATGSFLLTVSPPAGKTATASASTTSAVDSTPSSTGKAAGNAVAAPELPTDSSQASSPGTTYRCHRTSPPSEDTAIESPPTLHVADRFGELLAEVGEPRALCVPVATDADVLPTEPALARYGLVRTDHLPVPLGALRLRNVLGDVDIEVMKPDVVQTTATVAPALPGASVDAAAGSPTEPHACYRVRARGGAKRRSMTLAVPAGRELYRVSGPTRLCGIEQQPGSAAATMQLCYRARRAPAARDQSAEITAVAITSRFGTTATELRAVAEICLPSALVPTDAP